MSRRLSPLASNKAAPEPMSWGMKKFPNAPASWTKLRPTCSETSANQGAAGDPSLSEEEADRRQPSRADKRRKKASSKMAKGFMYSLEELAQARGCGYPLIHRV